MKAEVQKTGTDLSFQPPEVDIGRIDVRLCGPKRGGSPAPRGAL